MILGSEKPPWGVDIKIGMVWYGTLACFTNKKMKMLKTMREVEIVETQALRRREEERYVRSRLSIIAVCIHFATVVWGQI